MTKEQIAQNIEKECKEFVLKEMNTRNIVISKYSIPTEYDVANQFLFSKLAEYELRLRELENKHIVFK